MDRATILAALRRGTGLVASVPSMRPGWRGWVWVVGFYHNERPGWRNRDLVLRWWIREWNPRYDGYGRPYFEDDDVNFLAERSSTGEAELWALVDEFGGRDGFTYPWRTDYPD